MSETCTRIRKYDCNNKDIEKCLTHMDTGEGIMIQFNNLRMLRDYVIGFNRYLIDIVADKKRFNETKNERDLTYTLERVE